MRLIGVDLGGTKIQTALIEGDATDRSQPVPDEIGVGSTVAGWTIVAEDRTATPASEGVQATAEAVAGTIKSVGTESVEAVGIGFPGLVDHNAGVILRAPNLAGFDGGEKFAERVSNLVGLPVFLDNDVNVAVVAEHQIGAGENVPNLLGVWMGTGVGGGLILDGKLRRGPHGYAGEIGFLVVKWGGRKYGPLDGSLEAYAGRGSLGDHLKTESGEYMGDIQDIMAEKGKTTLTSSVFYKAYEKGDKSVVRLIDRAAQAIGIGIASLTNALDLERVVLGGGMGERFAPIIMGQVERVMKSHMMLPDLAPKIVAASLGDYSGALGAALTAKELLGASPSS